MKIIKTMKLYFALQIWALLCLFTACQNSPIKQSANYHFDTVINLKAEK